MTLTDYRQTNWFWLHPWRIVLAGIVVALAPDPEAIAFPSSQAVIPRLGFMPRSRLRCLMLSSAADRDDLRRTQRHGRADRLNPKSGTHGLEYPAGATVAGRTDLRSEAGLSEASALHALCSKSVMTGFPERASGRFPDFHATAAGDEPWGHPSE